MYRLPLNILLILTYVSVFCQSPHGSDLNIDCAKCHNEFGWEMDTTAMTFEHDETNFELEGAHISTDCKSCHESLIFNEAPNQCASCHTDIHSMSVGNDCARCHTATTWLVDNIPELHEESGFPLVGSHDNLSCVDCHTSETNLRFDNIGNECISCHREDYLATNSPNHMDLGFSTDCLECHNPLGIGWDTDAINHDFFPLTLGHDIQDCTECHTTGNFSDVSPECASCHQSDYDNTTEPDHLGVGYSTDCVTCHTTNLGWTPAILDHEFFPLTLGHDIQDCTECHTTGNYSDVSSECVSCHQSDYDNTTDPDHAGIGYSTDCASCHSTNPGWSPAIVDHDFFPLTLGHDIQDCMECHTTGNYSDASPECISCHQSDYDNTTDPDHSEAQFPTDCTACHTTNPNWTPVNWDHNDFYPLNGAHAALANDCVVCHNGDYTNTPNTCVGCHLDDYNSTTDPDHSAAQFPTDCMECHTEVDWVPSTFDHDGQYFPINSGAHSNEWDQCIDCHTNPNDYSVFTCITCHIETETNNDHSEVNGYVYESTACLSCHPSGDNKHKYEK